MGGGGGDDIYWLHTNLQCRHIDHYPNSNKHITHTYFMSLCKNVTRENHCKNKALKYVNCNIKPLNTLLCMNVDNAKKLNFH